MGDRGPDGEMSGSDVLLMVNCGTDASPAWAAVGTQKGVKFTHTVKTIDISSKNSAADRALPGRYGCTAALDALYVPEDAGYQALRAAMLAREMIKVRKSEFGVDIEEASALITSMSDDHPDSEASTISIALLISDGWTELTS